MNPYKELDVDRKASKEEIKKAYHKKAKANHPDKGGSTEKIKEINRAYAMLKDDTARAHFDKFGTEQKPDSELSNAVTCAISIIQGIIENDPNADIKRYIMKLKTQWTCDFESNMQNRERAKEKLNKFKKRILNHPQFDFISQYVSEQIKAVDIDIMNLERDWKARNRAFLLLSEYSFKDIERMQEMEWAGPGHEVKVTIRTI